MEVSRAPASLGMSEQSNLEYSTVLAGQPDAGQMAGHLNIRPATPATPATRADSYEGSRVKSPNKTITHWLI